MFPEGLCKDVHLLLHFLLGFRAVKDHIGVFHLKVGLEHLHGQRPADLARRADQIAVVVQQHRIQPEAVALRRQIVAGQEGVHEAAHEVARAEAFHIRHIGLAVHLRRQPWIQIQVHIRVLGGKVEGHGDGLAVVEHVVGGHGHVGVFVGLVNIDDAVLQFLRHLPRAAVIGHGVAAHHRISHRAQRQQDKGQYQRQRDFSFHRLFPFSDPGENGPLLRFRQRVRQTVPQGFPKLLFRHGTSSPSRVSRRFFLALSIFR